MALQYVGGTSGSGTGATYSVSLTALAGGLASAPAAGDLVVVVTGFAGTVDGNPGVTTAGYTEAADLWANDTRDTNLSVSYKVMGSTPDTSVTVNGANNGANGGATVVHVWRGADLGTSLDVTSTTATGTNGAHADAPSITPTSSGAVVIACGAGTGPTTQTAPASAPTGYANHVTVNGDGSSIDFYAAVASKGWTSGAEDPAAWAAGSSSNSDSWAAVALALRPGMPAISTLSDNFDDNSLDTGKWTDSDQANATSVEQNGVIEQQPTGTNAAYAFLNSTNSYSLLGSEIVIRAHAHAPQAGNREQFFQLTDAGNSTNFIRFVIADGTFYGGIWNADVEGANAFNVTYSASTHAWWRFRADVGGTVYWDTAPDTASNPPASGDWVNRGSKTYSTDIAWLASNVVVRLGTGQSLAGSAFTTPAKWDGVNAAANSSGVSAALTGQAAASAGGTLGAALDKALTGSGTTAARGTAIAATDKALTGQTAGAAIGTLGVDRSLVLAGQTASAARGAAAPTTDTPLAGLAISSAIGSVSAVSGFEVALTGQAAATARGAAAPTTDKALTGQAAATARGAAAPTTDKALAGLSAGVAQGGVTPSTAGSVGLTGVQASAARGTAIAATDKALTGQTAAAALGTVTPSPDTVVGLTGLGVATTRGTAIAATSKALAGLGATTARGVASAGTNIPLSGRSAATAPGSVLSTNPEAATLGSGAAFGSTAFGTVPFGGGSDAAVVALTGHGMAVSSGVINRQYAPVALTGHSVTVVRGTLFPAITPPGPLATLVGHRADSGVGRLGVVITTTPAGVQLVLQDGQIRPRQLNDSPSLRSAVVPMELTSVDVPFDTGVIVAVEANIALVPASPERAESN